jgi:molybdenum cofactor synthesis domain-containing protein
MDGIAVDSSAVAAASPGRPQLLTAGQYEPIDTGQTVPERFDSVIPREQLEWLGDEVIVREPAAAGRHVRRAGENVEAGGPILAAGRRLGAYDLALAAACGHTTLPVQPRPRVAVIPTGDEIRPLGNRLEAGEANDANSLMLSTLLREAGADVQVTPIVADGRERLERALARAAQEADLVLVIAGSAGGRRDQTAKALAAVGCVSVRGVSLRPAHPVILGRIDGVGVIGMPGYPMSTAFAFERFARPLVELLSGLVAPTTPIRIPVRLSAAITGRPDSEVQVPVALSGDGSDTPDALPGSRHGSALAALAGAHAVICLPPGTGELAAGEIVLADLLPSALGLRAAWPQQTALVSK